MNWELLLRRLRRIEQWWDGSILSGVTISGADNTLTNINQSSLDVVRARYASAATTTVPASGAEVLVNYGNLIFDSHSAVTTGAAWRFTAPAGQGGVYWV